MNNIFLLIDNFIANFDVQLLLPIFGLIGFFSAIRLFRWIWGSMFNE